MSAAAGVLLAAMAVGDGDGQPAGGRARVALAAATRVIVLQVVDGARDRAARRRRDGRLGLLGAALVIPGAALGALFATLYLLVDQLAPGIGYAHVRVAGHREQRGARRRRGGRRER